MRFYAVTNARNVVVSDTFQTKEEADHMLAVWTAMAVEGGYADELDRYEVRVILDSPSSLYVTSAPVDYDGFGARTVGMDPSTGDRIVDVVDEHATWQTMRYRSGMHRVTRA